MFIGVAVIVLLKNITSSSGRCLLAYEKRSFPKKIYNSKLTEEKDKRFRPQRKTVAYYKIHELFLTDQFD